MGGSFDAQRFFDDAKAALRRAHVTLDLGELRGGSMTDERTARATLIERLADKARADRDRAAASGLFVDDERLDLQLIDSLNGIVGSRALSAASWRDAGSHVDFTGRFPDGSELSWRLRSVDDLIAAFNSASHKTGDRRVFVSVRCSRGVMYLLADIERVDALQAFLPFE